ncbi:MAG: hypothetical protein HQM16_06990 [Deltaproteobacteria bacterium]|nr:hypothetical protein [Deltaproteobacteria bacterium]
MSHVAQKAGVTKAAVSKWFFGFKPKDFINVETQTVATLAKNLNVDLCVFFENQKNVDHYRTTFLWDSLFESVESFLWAIKQKRSPALARLVEVLGLHEASLVAGPVVMRKFHQYKHFIKPIRRKQMEVLWPLYSKT